MRILVCGSREWTDSNLVWTLLDGYYTNDIWMVSTASPFTVISGMADGADTHAADWVKNSPMHGEVVDLAKSVRNLIAQTRRTTLNQNKPA